MCELILWILQLFGRKNLFSLRFQAFFSLLLNNFIVNVKFHVLFSKIFYFCKDFPKFPTGLYSNKRNTCLKYLHNRLPSSKIFEFNSPFFIWLIAHEMEKKKAQPDPPEITQKNHFVSFQNVFFSIHHIWSSIYDYSPLQMFWSLRPKSLNTVFPQISAAALFEFSWFPVRRS